MQLVTITTKGQVTIPKKIREKLGLVPGDKVIFEEDKNSAKVRPAPDFFSFRGVLKSRPYNKKLAREAIGKYLGKGQVKIFANR